MPWIYTSLLSQLSFTIYIFAQKSEGQSRSKLKNKKWKKEEKEKKMNTQKSRDANSEIVWGGRKGDTQSITQKGDECFRRYESYLSDPGWSSFSFPWFLIIRVTFLFNNRGAFSYQTKENQVRLMTWTFIQGCFLLNSINHSTWARQYILISIYLTSMQKKRLIKP